MQSGISGTSSVLHGLMVFDSMGHEDADDDDDDDDDETCDSVS